MELSSIGSSLSNKQLWVLNCLCVVWTDHCMSLLITRHIAITVAWFLCSINFDIEKDWDPSDMIGTQDGGSVTIDILSLSMFNDCTKPPVKWDKGKETQSDFTTVWSEAWSWPWSGALEGCTDMTSGTGKDKVRPSVTGTYTWARGIATTKPPPPPPPFSPRS